MKKIRYMKEIISKYAGKKIIFLFDTNVYRRIVEIVRENRFSGNKFIIHAMSDRERESGCHSILSLTTSQELIAHLNEEDEDFTDCYQALRFQIFHTQKLQKPKLIANIDSLLSYFFYNTDTKDERLKFTGFVCTFLEKLFWLNKDIGTLKDEINKINEDFLYYKEEFCLFLKNIVVYSENVSIDSNGSKNDEGFKKSINDCSYIEIIKNYFIQRTKYFCKDDKYREINEKKVLEFEKYFKESLLHFRYLFESVLKNDINSSELKNSQWNAIKDFHIVFEWCFVKYFNKEKEIDVILVTQDRKRNFKSPDKNNEFKTMHDRNTDVWYMWQYFEFIGFKVDKTNPDKLVLRLENNFEIEGIGQWNSRTYKSATQQKLNRITNVDIKNI